MSCFSKMILLKIPTATQKHNQQTFKKQFRSFPYDFTKNSNRNSNRLSKTNFVFFHKMLLKTSTETATDFPNQFRSFPYDFTNILRVPRGVVEIQYAIITKLFQEWGLKKLQ